VLVLGALLVLGAGVAVGFVVNGDGEDETPTSTVPPTVTTSTTTTTTTTTTTVPPTTTAAPPTSVAPLDACAAGDQRACDQLPTPQLQDQCDAGNTDACQVLIARQGDVGDVEGD